MLVTVRLDPQLVAALSRAGGTETRTRSQQIRRYLAAGLTRDGYLMVDPAVVASRAADGGRDAR